MNGKTAIFASFIGAVAIITWRDFTNPSSDWPLPAPPPFRYAGAAVAFGLLALVAEFVNEKVPAVLAVGLLIGLGFQTSQSGVLKKSASQSPDTGAGVIREHKNRKIN